MSLFLACKLHQFNLQSGLIDIDGLRFRRIFLDD